MAYPAKVIFEANTEQVNKNSSVQTLWQQNSQKYHPD